MWDQFDDHKTVIKTVITHINHTVTDAGSTAVEEGGNAVDHTVGTQTVDHTVGTQTAVVGGGPISTTFYNFTALRGNTSTKW
jgi:gamma-glutamyltranspeptidase